jgi:hypothetical protein
MEVAQYRSEMIFDIVSKNIKNILKLPRNDYEPSFKVKRNGEDVRSEACFSGVMKCHFPFVYYPIKKELLHCGEETIQDIELIKRAICIMFKGVNTDMFKDFPESLKFNKDGSIDVEITNNKFGDKSYVDRNIITIIRGMDEWPHVWNILWGLLGGKLFDLTKEELIACYIVCETFVIQNDNHKLFSKSNHQYSSILNIGNKTLSSETTEYFFGDKRNFARLPEVGLIRSGNSIGTLINRGLFGYNSQILVTNEELILNMFKERFLTVIK